MYVTTFEVTGAGIFPRDMLRYDSCEFDGAPEEFPNTASRTDMLRALTAPRRTVRIRATHSRRKWEPTLQRWASFGWTVNRASYQTVKQ